MKKWTIRLCKVHIELILEQVYNEIIIQVEEK